jgi:hypothetical protein
VAAYSSEAVTKFLASEFGKEKTEKWIAETSKLLVDTLDEQLTKLFGPTKETIDLLNKEEQK